jgi:thymidylate synthase
MSFVACVYFFRGVGRREPLLSKPCAGMPKLEAILAASRDGIIGVNGALPWKLPADLRRFARITRGSTIVMGRKTWDSLPIKPLPDRDHVVVTSCPRPVVDWPPRVTFCALAEIGEALARSRRVFVIGGAQLLSQLLPLVNVLHLTWVDVAVRPPPEASVARLPPLVGMSIVSWEQQRERGAFEFLRLERTGAVVGESPYLELLRDILVAGARRPDRTGTGTIGVFGRQLRFDISKSVPVVTTKQMAWKTCLRELLWFLSGSTDSTELQRRGVNIWRGNSSREFLDARGLFDLPEGDIGPGYGFQWRHFGARYTTCKADYEGQGVDQVAAVIEGIRRDPFGRRHIVSAWNPAALAQMALPPCHVMFQFYVDDQRRLSCQLYQRSADCFLGLPFNMLSYAALTYLVALRTDTRPHELVISLGDAHIYQDHLDQVRLQLERSPYPSPLLAIDPATRDMPWEAIDLDEHVRLVGYMHHEAIAARMAV